MTKEDLLQISELLDAKLDEKLDEKLAPINQRLDRLEHRIDSLEHRVDDLAETVDAIKEDTEITRGTTNALCEWAEHVAVITAAPFPVRHDQAQ